MTPGKIPLKARLPWFQIWVPIILLLYLLINGAGHVEMLAQWEPLTSTMPSTMERLRVPLLWSTWAFLIYPCLLILAYASWRLAPQFGSGGRWASGLVGLFLFCLFLLLQGWMIGAHIPNPTASSTWARQRRILLWLWKPHLGRPGLKPTDRDVAALLKDKDSELRRLATKELGYRGAEEFASGIAKLLEDPDGEVRYEAVHTLGKCGAKEFSPDIARFLGDPNPAMRGVTASALGKLGAKEYAPDMIKLLADPDEHVRILAACGLSFLRAREFFPEIAKLLEDPQWNVRVAAISILDELDAKEFSPDIAKLLKDSEQSVRRAAAITLKKLNASSAPTDPQP